MRIYLAPIAPDTIASLKEDLRPIAEKFGLLDRLRQSTGFAEILVMDIPEDENSREFIRRAKQLCEVQVTPA